MGELAMNKQSCRNIYVLAYIIVAIKYKTNMSSHLINIFFTFVSNNYKDCYCLLEKIFKTYNARFQL